MNVFEQARELANSLLESEQGKKMKETQYIFDGNEEARQQLLDYNSYREAINTRVQSGELSEDEMKAEAKKLREMLTELKKNPIINDMVVAEGNFRMLVDRVMNIFNFTLSGEDVSEEGCNGQCSGCSGCH